MTGRKGKSARLHGAGRLPKSIIKPRGVGKRPRTGHQIFQDQIGTNGTKQERKQRARARTAGLFEKAKTKREKDRPDAVLGQQTDEAEKRGEKSAAGERETVERKKNRLVQESKESVHQVPP